MENTSLPDFHWHWYLNLDPSCDFGEAKYTLDDPWLPLAGYLGKSHFCVTSRGFMTVFNIVLPKE